jgi:hypothetical protein
MKNTFFKPDASFAFTQGFKPQGMVQFNQAML